MLRLVCVAALVALALAAPTAATLAQETAGGRIQGKVTDAETGEPLVGAEVFIQGTQIGGLSDLDGNWWEILTNPPGGYAWMFKQGGDLKAWGAGEGDRVNPNAYKGRNK